MIPFGRREGPELVQERPLGGGHLCSFICTVVAGRPPQTSSLCNTFVLCVFCIHISFSSNKSNSQGLHFYGRFMYIIHISSSIYYLFLVQTFKSKSILPILTLCWGHFSKAGIQTALQMSRFPHVGCSLASPL